MRRSWSTGLQRGLALESIRIRLGIPAGRHKGVADLFRDAFIPTETRILPRNAATLGAGGIAFCRPRVVQGCGAQDGPMKVGVLLPRCGLQGRHWSVLSARC